MKSDLSIMEDYGSLPTETPVCADGASRLLRLANLAQEVGAEAVNEEVRDLAARVSEGRFYVACVGQFKRGKSTPTERSGRPRGRSDRVCSGHGGAHSDSVW